MNYRINIIDTQNEELVTQLEKAVRGGARLIHQGSNKKDGQPINGSALELGIIAEKYVDGYLYDLFTGDETRYRVEIIDDNDTYIWQGHILPDEYSEPFTNTPVINITATDGLGRLKGKYLPETFYEDEHSVIDILANCLLLTGLELDIRFAPAIQNTLQTDFKLVYLDGLRWVNKDKRDDAYAILQDLLGEVNILYQLDNHWNFEGINIRNLRVYKTKVYSPQGEYIEEIEITRLRKDINGIATPVISMQPPYGLINITHDREDVFLPETLSKEENDGWALTRKSAYYIYATDWFGTGDFFAKAANYKNLSYWTTQNIQDRGEYAVYFGRRPNPFDLKELNLRTKPYLIKGNKYRLDLDFKLFPFIGLTEAQRQTYIDTGEWTDPFALNITIKSDEGVETLFGNYYPDYNSEKRITQSFNIEGEMQNSLDFIPNQSGLLNIQMFGVLPEDNGIEYVHIAKAEISTIGFEEIRRVNISLDSEYTLEKEIELSIGSDATGFSWAYRLAKLRTLNNVNEISVPIKRTLNRDGFWYASVDLEGANLIKENIDSVLYNGSVFPVRDVIYNWKNSEEFMIELDSNVSGNFTVNVYDYNSTTENRDHWEYWTDAIYKVEKLKYIEVVGNIYKRMFDVPLPSIQNFTVKTNVKFNDFVVFNWRDTSEWMITNCEWDIDQGFTDISISKTYYAINSGGNLPPVVEAGNDLTIGEGVTEIALTSEAYDPDGFIVRYTWREVTNNGAVIQNPNDQNITVTGLTGDYYEFEVEVEDNDGATASDLVKVFRVQPHALIVTENIVSDLDQFKERTYSIGFDPNIAEGATLNIKGTFYVEATQHIPFSDASAYFKIKIDGVYLREHEVGLAYGDTGSNKYFINDEFSLSYYNGNVIEFELHAQAGISDPGGDNPYAKAEFTIQTIDFIDGNGSITDLPQTRSIEVLI